MKSSRLIIVGACIAIVLIIAVLVVALSPSMTGPKYWVTVENKDIKDVGFMWQRFYVRISATVRNHEPFPVEATLKYWIRVQDKNTGQTMEIYYTETVRVGDVGYVNCQLDYPYTHKLVSWGVDVIKTEKASD